MRYVCDTCHRIHYENPRVVVGCIPDWEGKILMCRRAIEPRLGFWTIPAGFLEKGETLADGAAREALEEAHARVEILPPFTLMDLPHVGQVYVVFRSRLLDKDFNPGHESLEVKLFTEKEISWEEIAFTSIRESLQLFFNDRKKGTFPLHTGRIYPMDNRPRNRFQELYAEGNQSILDR